MLPKCQGFFYVSLLLSLYKSKVIKCPFTLWLILSILPVPPYPWIYGIPGISSFLCFPAMTQSNILLVSLQNGIHPGSDSGLVSHKLEGYLVRGFPYVMAVYGCGWPFLQLQLVSLAHRMGGRFRKSSAYIHF